MAGVDKQVLLEVQGLRSGPQNESDESVLMVRGRLQIDEELVRLSYEEAGEDGLFLTAIEIADGMVNLCREGPFSSNLALRKGCQSKSVFETPLGRFEIEAFSTFLSYELGENEGKLRLSYQLTMQGEQMGLNHLSIAYWDAAG
ncbi:MAG: DUF1934 domain-containing protein [Christensenellaceae bacterium]|jgi:uncharacterized beta-barrel protein YwiB (DUF1934 family)|nr:DUF1934 domain-containing protein [Christensenellaceae bacterium]